VQAIGTQQPDWQESRPGGDCTIAVVPVGEQVFGKLLAVWATTVTE
jgi:hypothetical protein